MRPLGVIGPLSRDVVAGSPPRIGGGPWHAGRALRALNRRAVLVGTCSAADRPGYQRRIASLGLPAVVAGRGETTAFSFSYDPEGARTMQVDAIGDPLRPEDIPAAALRGIEWLQVVPLVRGDVDLDLLAWLARGRRILLDAQGLVRARKTGPLELDGAFDRALLQHVTVLKLAEEEAAAIGDDVASLGVPEVLVTSGARGARVIARGVDLHVPARPVATDPTGSGDAFAVAYAAARSEGHRPVSAARRATALVAALLAGGAR